MEVCFIDWPWQTRSTRMLLCSPSVCSAAVLLPQGYAYNGQTHVFPVMPGEFGSYFNSSQNPCQARCATLAELL